MESVYLDPQYLCEDTRKIQGSHEWKEYNQSLVYDQETCNSTTTTMRMLKSDLNLKSIYGQDMDLLKRDIFFFHTSQSNFELWSWFQKWAQEDW